MIECGSSLRLSPEAFKSPVIMRHLGRQEFERCHALQAGIFNFVNDAHPAAAQLLDYAVVRNGFADHWSRSYVPGNCQVNESDGWRPQLAG